MLSKRKWIKVTKLNKKKAKEKTQITMAGELQIISHRKGYGVMLAVTLISLIFVANGLHLVGWLIVLVMWGYAIYQMESKLQNGWFNKDPVLPVAKAPAAKATVRSVPAPNYVPPMPSAPPAPGDNQRPNSQRMYPTAL